MLTIKEVRDELWSLWIPAKSRGDPKPPKSRVTFSRTGWLEVLSDPEIRQFMWGRDPLATMETVFGAEIKVESDLGFSNAERFRAELLNE